MNELSDDEKHSLANCDRVKHTYPIKGLQVLPVPGWPDGVQVRIGGNSAWRTMRVNDAIDHTRWLVRRDRKRRTQRIAGRAWLAAHPEYDHN